jgi:hypothetical protein
MKTGLIEPHYLPCLEYFCALLPFDNLVLEKHGHYVKQSLRNRCHINTAQGPKMLVVPLTAKHGKVPFKDIRIDRTGKWQNNHWRSIQSAYAKAPFFEHYAPELLNILYRDFDFIFDLNREVLSFCLNSLGLRKELSESGDYQMEVGLQVCDLRSQITSKKPYSSRAFYQPEPYNQVFGNTFASNLSLIDLLFCEGPYAPAILKASGREI